MIGHVRSFSTVTFWSAATWLGVEIAIAALTAHLGLGLFLLALAGLWIAWSIRAMSAGPREFGTFRRVAFVVSVELLFVGGLGQALLVVVRGVDENLGFDDVSRSPFSVAIAMLTLLTGLLGMFRASGHTREARAT